MLESVGLALTVVLLGALLVLCARWLPGGPARFAAALIPIAGVYFIAHYAAGNLEKISGGYRPLTRVDGTEYDVAAQTSGGPCGEGWQGSLH